MLGLFILISSLTLENVRSQGFVVPRVVRTREIINSSNQKVSEELQPVLTHTESNTDINKTRESPLIPNGVVEDTYFNLSSGNLAVKSIKNNNQGNNKLNMSKVKTENLPEVESSKGDKVITKPLELPQGNLPLPIVPIPPSLSSSDTAKHGSPSLSTNGTNTTNIDFNDRSNFNGDKCPTGYVRVDGKCVETE